MPKVIQRLIALFVNEEDFSKIFYQNPERVYLLALILLLVPIAALFLSFYSLYQGDYLVVVADLILIAVFVTLIVLVRKAKSYHAVTFVAILMCGGYLLYFFISATFQIADDHLILWVFVYPLLSMFLLRKKFGSLASLGLFILMIGVHFIGSRYYSAGIPSSLFNRFIFVYFFLYMLSFIYETFHTQVSDRLHVEKTHITDIAIHDGLTGIYNRSYFDEVMDRLVADSKTTLSANAYMMFDIDFFKLYNDNYGHPAGDSALTQFAHFLENLTQRRSDLVFRYGGEEFAIILTNATYTIAKAFCEQTVSKFNHLNLPHKKSPFGT